MRSTASELSKLYPDCREDGITTLRQCQLVMIRMLKILDHICTAERISYWMTAGTLIGALRHRGMIPWDCDIDVAMTEDDYQAFCRAADQLPPDIFFQNPQTDPFFQSTIMAKLRDRYSNYVESQSRNLRARCHNGLQVDLIFYRANAEGQLVNPFRQTAYAQDEIFPLTRLEFEGAQLPAPRDPDQYIRRRYGDYMRIPPPEERVPHEGMADPFRPCDHPESRVYPNPYVRPSLLKRLAGKARPIRMRLGREAKALSRPRHHS
jgi:lipopolysaccharide cholinephosphotransferase